MEKAKTGSSNIKPFSNWFQIRWNERLGDVENPYLIRWTFIFLGYSIRLHHWIKSDDRRFFHDHSSNLLSIVLKGNYFNVNPYPGYEDRNPDFELVQKQTIHRINGEIETKEVIIENRDSHYVEGIFNSWGNFFNLFNSIWYSKATKRHYLDIPKGGAWTLLIEGRKFHKWGFYVNGHKWRPLRYFHKYGIIQDKDYQ